MIDDVSIFKVIKLKTHLTWYLLLSTEELYRAPFLGGGMNDDTAESFLLTALMMASDDPGYSSAKRLKSL